MANVSEIKYLMRYIPEDVEEDEEKISFGVTSPMAATKAPEDGEFTWPDLLS